jgi:hypothetical protein
MWVSMVDDIDLELDTALVRPTCFCPGCVWCVVGVAGHGRPVQDMAGHGREEGLRGRGFLCMYGGLEFWRIKV